MRAICVRGVSCQAGTATGYQFHRKLPFGNGSDKLSGRGQPAYLGFTGYLAVCHRPLYIIALPGAEACGRGPDGDSRAVSALR